MAEGKWIAGLKANTALAQAARLTLKARLEVVRANLDPAWHESERDPEYVHQLRVGSRRAVAAVELFAPCLPLKTYRRARKKLRRLRRAAGMARDWDVFLLTLTSRTHRRASTGFLLGYALGQRTAAQAILEAAVEEFPAGFEQFAQETLALIDEPAQKQLAVVLIDIARPVLADLLRQFQEALSASAGDYEQLHRIRIIGKRLRYTMEVFGNCFSKTFRQELYPPVEALQDILGRLNDSRIAVRNLQSLGERLCRSRPREWKTYRPEIENALELHQRRLPREAQRFRKWRKEWNSSGAGGIFVALLQQSIRAAP